MEVLINHSRRRFIAGSLIAGSALALTYNQALAFGGSPVWPFAVGQFPIWQGMTNAHSAQLTVVVDEGKDYSFMILSSQGQAVAAEVVRKEVSRSKAKVVVKLRASNLSLGTAYRLQVIDNVSGQVLDDRDFTALDLNRPELTWGLLSCANDYLFTEQDRMWQRVGNQNADILFFIGDSVYADNNSSKPGDHSGGWDNYWQRYLDVFHRLSLYRLKKLTPILAVWDDHDFGVNNGDSSFREKDITTFLFQLFWGNELTDGYEKGPGVSSVLNVRGQRFILLDNRTYRSESLWGGGEHWGGPVEEFLYSKVGESKDPAWVLAGSQVFGGYMGTRNSFEGGWGDNLKDVLGQLKKMDAPVLFGSGDVHFSEIMRLEPALLGYQTYEFTSSSIHSYTAPGQHLRKLNPRRVSALSEHNFMIFNSRSAGVSSVSFDCRAVTKNSNAFITHSGSVTR